MPVKEVAAAIIIKDKKILICRRGKGGSCAYLWEFPGGKREKNETLEQCLMRECLEELGIDIVVEKIFHKTLYRYPEADISLTFFYAKIISGAPEPRIQQEILWVKPGDLTAYDFCPADTEVIHLLKESGL